MKAELTKDGAHYILRVSGNIDVGARYPVLIDVDPNDNDKLARSQTVQYVLHELRIQIERALDA